MAVPQLKSMIFGAFSTLFFFSLVVSKTCPKECICNLKSNFIRASCKINNVTSIDSIDLLPESIRVLKLVCRKDIPFLFERLWLQKFSRLQSIMFRECTFDNLNKQAFEGLQFLENLYIFHSVNLILPQYFFHHIRKLKRVIISKSDWQIFSLDDFCLLNNITLIAFSMNSIKEIVQNSTSCPENYFSHLKQLYLNDNKIRTLRKGVDKRFQAITYLTFLNNQIEEIQTGSLVDLPQLKFLDISQNYIQELPGDLCNGCPKLWELRISQNPIRELPESFSKLHNLKKFQAKNTFISDISIVVNMSIADLNVQNCTLTYIPMHICGNNSSLEIGIFKENKIQDIPANTFEQCCCLKDLDLSVNLIKSLNANSFNGLDQLVNLDLSINNISHIDHRTFQQLKSLRYLNLSNNVLTEKPIFPSDVRIIDFGRNKLQKIQFYILTLYELSSLNLEMNHIQGIDNDAFLCCIFLAEVSMKHNEIKYIKEFAFRGMSHLVLLNIAYNKIEDVNSVLKNLRSLRKLHAQHNRISILSRDMFPEAIREINLSNNKIKIIVEGTFENLKYLKNVDLRWNELVTLDAPSMRLNPNIMVVTDFSVFGNPLKCDCHLASLKTNSINKYPIFPDLAPSECIQDDIHYLEAAALNSSDQQQFVCGYKRNSLFNLPFPCYLNCQCCSTENCLCQHKCVGRCLCTFTYDLAEFRVDCQNLNLTDATGIPHNAIFVDLSANQLGYLTNESFSGKTMIEILYLNDSKITGIGARTFINFNRLQVLHLEYNGISILDSNDFGGLRNLNKLILNHNKIERILPGTFDATPSLEMLDLRHNNLRKIDSQTFNVDHLKSILLFANPWSCECEDINKLSSVLITRFSQIDSQNIFCNRSEIPIIKYDMRFCREKTLNRIRQTSISVDDVHVYVLSIGLPILAFLLGTVIIVYVYRIEIQILCFVRFGWRILSRKNKMDEEDKKYDAFVSYHNSQDEFVVNEMLPRLEESATPAYKLCVHFRDFPVGAPIVDNIIESIENSKRTILLLTNQFLTSEWCRYEFQAAHLESLSTNMNSLVLVLLQDVDPDLVDGGLKLYMKTKTYLRYDDARFWDKLRFALPEKKEEDTKL